MQLCIQNRCIWNDGRVQVRTFSPFVDPSQAFMAGDRNEFDLQVQVPGI